MPLTATEQPTPSKCRRPGRRKLGAGAALILPALVLGAGLSLAAPAETKARSSLAMTPTKGVNVSVSFSIQLPLSDLSEKVIARQQESGRRLFYRLSMSECKVLLEIIAATCRLSSLNVSTHLRERNNQTPMKLYLSGSARYVVTLKEKLPKEKTPAYPSILKNEGLSRRLMDWCGLLQGRKSRPYIVFFTGQSNKN